MNPIFKNLPNEVLLNYGCSVVNELNSAYLLINSDRAINISFVGSPAFFHNCLVYTRTLKALCLALQANKCTIPPTFEDALTLFSHLEVFDQPIKS